MLPDKHFVLKGEKKMAKTKALWACKECGHIQVKWTGSCPSCQQWDTLVEEAPVEEVASRLIGVILRREICMHQVRNHLFITILGRNTKTLQILVIRDVPFMWHLGGRSEPHATR